MAPVAAVSPPARSGASPACSVAATTPALAALPHRRRRLQTRPGGFTILELSVALVVIAIILGAVMKANDLFTTANYQHAHNRFVEGWIKSFQIFNATHRYLPGDDPAAPTDRVAGRLGVAELCNSAGDKRLSNEFLGVHIEIPEGMGAGVEDEFVYQDEEGMPRRLIACFATVDWTLKGETVSTVRTVKKHVLHLKGVSRRLATQLDAVLDHSISTRAGRVRSIAGANAGTFEFEDWPVTTDGELELYITAATE